MLYGTGLEGLFGHYVVDNQTCHCCEMLLAVSLTNILLYVNQKMAILIKILNIVLKYIRTLRDMFDKNFFSFHLECD